MDYQKTFLGRFLFCLYDILGFMKTATVTLIYPHQLLKQHPGLSQDRIVVLVEESLLFTQFRFHKQKIMFHRATMRAYQHMLEKRGYTVWYVEFHELKKTGDIVSYLLNRGVQTIHVCDVVDDWIAQRLQKSCNKKIELVWHDNACFLTHHADLDSFFLEKIKQKKQLLMHTFYVWQRKRLNILIDSNGKPFGGSWSYDVKNRKKIPRNQIIPNDPKPISNEYVEESRKYTEKYFPKNYGTTESFFYPITHKDAVKWLEKFIHERLELFGPYEDAMTTQGNRLWHSILSPLLNVGLLTPDQVISATLQYTQDHFVPIESVEGFIRQIVGWREYMRAMYVYKGRSMRSQNIWNGKRTLSESLWNGTTGITPLDSVIQKTLTTGYVHHIERLMIAGNFFMLGGYHPDQVYKWFMTLFIDAYDWVMVPNVYGMILCVDGGTITTKPYVSGSHYILTMSDYQKGDWSLVWDGLFWNFIDTHKKRLEQFERMSFMIAQVKKMDSKKLTTHKKIATQFLQQGSLLNKK